MYVRRFTANVLALSRVDCTAQRSISSSISGIDCAQPWYLQTFCRFPAIRILPIFHRFHFSTSSPESEIKMPAAGVVEVNIVDSPSKRQKMMEVDDEPSQQQQAPAAAQQQTQIPVLKYAKMAPDASEPVRSSDLAAGYDLKSNEDKVVLAKGKALIKTDIQIALPDGCYGRIAPRSGLSVKNFIDVGAGVIDQDYRGEVRVLLFNFSAEDFKVTKGMRIAQLICERIYLPQLQACESLDETKRGAGGFGSTGTH